MTNGQGRLTIEVCVADADVARAAVDAGADRLEINSRLDLDGLTPAEELVRETSELGVPVIAMARPDTRNNRFEAAGFVYCDSDKIRLLDDARRVLDLGATGVAAGALTESGTIDVPFLQELRDVCEDQELVFHRAFDVATDWRKAFELVAAGRADRLLTSGGAPTAMEGRTVLGELVRQDMLEILPASGITADNAVSLIKLTGCTQIHGSFSGGAKETGSLASLVASRIKTIRNVFEA